MKRFTLLALAFLTSSAFANSIHFPAGITPESIHTAAVRIVYDIHDVLAQRKAEVNIVNKMLSFIIDDLNNSYRPMPDMQTLIQELHQCGYKQQIASNIAEVSFKKLKEKFAKKKYGSTIFSILQPGKIIATSGAPEVCAYPKPSPLFFADFNRTYTITPSDIVVFIDDRLENIKAATQAGWIGIHFQSPTQLRADLKKLRLL